MEPHLQQVTLLFGDVIAESGEPVRQVYFPFAGVVSLVVEMKVGDMIETAMVGRDGVVNGTAALDSKMSFHKGLFKLRALLPVLIRTLFEVSRTNLIPCVRSSSDTSRCFSLRRSSQPAAMRATRSKRACAGGSCVCAI
jgi:hypothetical protein